MSTVRLCKECGASLPTDAPEGLCPKCLMKAAVGDSSVVGVGSRGTEQRTSNIERSTLNDTGDTTRISPPTTDYGPRTTLRYFGDYELIEEIARGGMGVVYKARQVSLNRVVAVKMILAGQLAGDAEVKRFHTEAEAAANLQHPNIVTIHEIGEHEGQHYFSMDYVAGRNLAQIAREQPMSPQVAAQCAKAIAEAIQYAHQRGILHRDLKPQNVLVDERGQPRVTDFGLAKLTKLDSSLTRTGAVLGSPAYMPPEQAAGRDDQVGPASDVYSLGAILYELLARKPPHTGATPLETLRHVMEQPVVPPSRFNPLVNRDLETICLKCLEKEPSRRYATARELAEDLGRFLNREPIRARRANRARRGWSWVIRHPWVLTGIASLVVLLTVGFAYRMWERVAALEWQSVHPGVKPPFNAEYFLPEWFQLLLFLEFFFLQGIPVSSFLTLRARRQRGNWFYYLFAAVGTLQSIFGLEVLRRAVATQAWGPQWLFGPAIAAVPALTNVWFGGALVWKALREARLDLPGMDFSAAPIELPLRFANRGAINRAIRCELFGGLVLMIVVAVLTNGKPDDVGAVFAGMAGMLGTTLFVLIDHAMGRSTGLERQARLPSFLGAMALAAFGLLGVTVRPWYSTLDYYALGFLVGRLLLKRCPLERSAAGAGSGNSLVRLLKWLLRFSWRPRTRYAVAAVIAFLVLFYLEEDWRGVRAWHRAKARLEARGETVDWAAFLPTRRVPDNQNVFKHPFMLEYGVRKGWFGRIKELDWLDPGFIGYGLESGPPIPMSTLKKLPRQPVPPLTFASIDPRLAKAQPTSSFEFDGCDLADAVRTLARKAGIQLIVESDKEPFTARGWSWEAGTYRWTSTNVTCTFKVANTTATAVLEALLQKHHLQPELDAAVGVYRFRPIYTSLAELEERFMRHQDQVQQFEGALRRPYAQLDSDQDTPMLEMSQPNLVLLRTAAQGLATRSKIRLLQGNAEGALRDLRLIKQIGDAALVLPTLVGGMIKVAITGLLVNTLEEELLEGLWPPAQLDSVQKELGGIELLPPWSTAVQYERAFNAEAIRRLSIPWKYWQDRVDFLLMLASSKPAPSGGIKLSPARLLQPLRGWFEQNMIQVVEAFDLSNALTARAQGDAINSTEASPLTPTGADRWFAAAMLLPPRGWFYQNMAQVIEAPDPRTVWDPRQRIILASKAAVYEAGIKKLVNPHSPYKFLWEISLGNYAKALAVAARNQTLANEAIVACALERYRAAKGNYPDKLDTLVPEFAAKLPHDLFDGQPLRYRRTGDGRYLLYSIGWNSKDDHGEMDSPPDPNHNANWSDDHGDWVWQGVPRQ